MKEAVENMLELQVEQDFQQVTGRLTEGKQTALLDSFQPPSVGKVGSLY